MSSKIVVAIKNLYLSIVRTGTQYAVEEEAISRIVFVNTISLSIGALLLLISPFVFHVMNWDSRIVIPIFFEFVINGSVIFFNYHNRPTTASAILYFLQCAAILYFGFLLGELFHLQFMIMFLISIIYLIFKKGIIRKVALSIALLSLALIQTSYYFSAFHPIDIGYNTGYIIQTLVIGGVLLLMLLVSRKYVKSNDTNPELKRANHFIKIFTAQVTHELRTPLNTIHQINLMLKKEVTNHSTDLKEMGPLLNLSLVATNQARNIINNVLDMAEIESGKTEKISRESIMLQTFFSKIIEVNKVIAKLEHIKLRLSIQKMPAVIVGDPINLHQVTTNLVSNAIKYGDKDSTIQILITGREDVFTLQVINRGPGIPTDKLDTIFDPFTRGKDCHIEGTGLGLYIVRNKVAAMGGTVTVDCDPYHYTTFTVTLPLIKGRLINIPINPTEDEWGEELIDLKNTQVLIAEDNKLSALMLFMHLNDLGCSVTSVDNGLDLLVAAEKSHPDVIIMDYHMPLMDGEKTVFRLKENPMLCNIPIIISTGDIYAEALDKMLMAGADTFVEKPVDIRTLQKTISRHLRKDIH